MMLRLLFLISLICCAIVGFAQDQMHFSWIENKGQYPDRFEAHARIPGGNVYWDGQSIHWLFYDQKAVAKYHDTKKAPDSLAMHYLKTNFEGAKKRARFSLLGKKSYYENYYISNIAASEVATFDRFFQYGIYNGIDLEVLATKDALKYNFYVAPQADPQQITIGYEGQNNLSLTKEGNLLIKTSLGAVQEMKPVAWHTIGDQKIPVKANYTIRNNKVSFVLGTGYRKDLPLVIDPVLIISSYSMSVADNWGFTATYDREGYLYGGGNIFAPQNLPTNFPVTAGAFQIAFAGGIEDIVISKYPSSGGLTRLFSTFLGGSNFDNPMSLNVDPVTDELVVLSKTRSTDFPTTANAFQRVNRGGMDIAITKFNITGTALIGSTYIGGSLNDGDNQFNINYNENSLNYNYGDYARSDLGIDTAGNIFLVSHTFSVNFPVTSNAFQNTKGAGQDAVICKFNPTLSNLMWSSFFGGNNQDSGYGMYLKPNGKVYITGGTLSQNLSNTAGCYQTTNPGGVSGYIAAIDVNSSTLLRVTYIGTPSYDQTFFVQLDNDGNVFTVGQSEGNMPRTSGTWGIADGRQFILKLDSNLTNVLAATTFGNGLLDGNDRVELSPSAFLVDVCDRIYFSAWGGNVNNVNRQTEFLGNTTFLPTTNNAISNSTDGSDFYLMVLDQNMSGLIYASYLGGKISHEHVDGGTSRFDPKGVIYQCVCAGCGGHSDFPVNDGSLNLSNNCNMAVFKLDFELGPAFADFRPNPRKATGCPPFKIQFTNLSTKGIGYFWDFDDGTTSTSVNPIHIFNVPGTYNVKLTAKDTLYCFRIDSITIPITVLEPPAVTLNPIPTLCPKDTFTVTATNSSGVVNTYTWLSNPNIVSSFNNTATIAALSNSNISVMVSNGTCEDTFSTALTVFDIPDALPPDTAVCKGGPFNFPSYLDNGNFIQFEWLTGPTGADRFKPHPTFTLLVDSSFVVSAQTKDSCWTLDTIKINMKFGFDTQADPDKFLCPLDTTTLTVYNGSKWFWSTGDTTKTIQVSPLDTTTYVVQAVAQNGCYGKPDSVKVMLNDIYTFFISEYDTGVAPQNIGFTNMSQGANIYTWYVDGKKAGSDFNFKYLFNKIGSYEVKLYAYNSFSGCIDSFLRMVYIDTFLLELPNVFTPSNNDKLNDTFSAVHKNIKEFNIKIYSRAAELIYESDNVNFQWDGTYKGDVVQQGSYNYMVKAKAINGAPINMKRIVTVLK